VRGRGEIEKVVDRGTRGEQVVNASEWGRRLTPTLEADTSRELAVTHK
jgi:hypothetical protein